MFYKGGRYLTLNVQEASAMTPKKVGFLGTGGGFFGAAAVGWLEGIIEWCLANGHQIVSFGGASVNALNFAKHAEAQNPKELLEKNREAKEIWLNIERLGPRAIFPFRNGIVGLLDCGRQFAAKGFLLKNATLWDLVQNPKVNPQPFDAERVLSSPFELDIFVAEEKTGRLISFSKRDRIFQERPELLRAVLVASCAIPTVFEPVEIRGKYYRDSGRIKPSAALRAGCDLIFVLCPGFPGRDPEFSLGLRNRIVYNLSRAYRDMVREWNRDKILQLRVATEELEIPPPVVIHLEETSATLTPYGFRPGDLAATIRHAREQIDRVLEELEKELDNA